MLSNLLSTVAAGGKVIIEEENYLLARVSIDGRAMLAEISIGSSGGLSPGDWPEIDGILLPDSLIHPGDESGTRILLFAIPDNAELYVETIVRDGGFSEANALETGKKLLDILRRIHDEGHRVGYLGPENVLRTDTGKHFILGGARGIPDTPFSPPEAVGRTADDPRSDIYALGLLIFRLIAGSDNREIQIEVWNNLSNRVLKLLENMVSLEADNRFPNLIVLANELKHIEPEYWTKEKETGRDHSVNRRRITPVIVITMIIIAVITALLLIINPDSSRETQSIEPDSGTWIQESDSLLADQDLPSDETDSLQVDALAEPVIWISNGTVQPGRASEFRQGPASEFSIVYTCTATLRSNSILLARRDDPHLPPENQERICSIAEYLASHDSTILIKPVDITMLLGSDITDDSIMSGIVMPVSNPAGTLYVDIANHGLEGVYSGAGAATWVRSVVNNMSIILEGEEWLITVVDFRDGDRLNAELGIPDSLDSTLFLYRNNLPLLDAAEEELRKLFLDNATGEYSRATAPVPPDIWIILGN
ncbi:MAG: hypothetical protein K8S24_11070 [Candidatus Aegiribacteria sp.]|nr:hypothetical protein [Candidatus Aegiribacteria sp.]